MPPRYKVGKPLLSYHECGRQTEARSLFGKRPRRLWPLCFSYDSAGTSLPFSGYFLSSCQLALLLACRPRASFPQNNETKMPGAKINLVFFHNFETFVLPWLCASAKDLAGFGVEQAPITQHQRNLSIPPVGGWASTILDGKCRQSHKDATSPGLAGEVSCWDKTKNEALAKDPQPEVYKQKPSEHTCEYFVGRGKSLGDTVPSKGELGRCVGGREVSVTPERSINLPPGLGAHVGQDDGGADRVAVDVVLGPLRGHHLPHTQPQRGTQG